MPNAPIVVSLTPGIRTVEAPEVDGGQAFVILALNINLNLSAKDASSILFNDLAQTLAIPPNASTCVDMCTSLLLLLELFEQRAIVFKRTQSEHAPTQVKSHCIPVFRQACRQAIWWSTNNMHRLCSEVKTNGHIFRRETHPCGVPLRYLRCA